jgi:hypothetical protein
MGKNGKMLDILFETPTETGTDGLIHTINSWAILWADKGLEGVIASVEGVIHASEIVNTKYVVWFDARYDVEYVKKEIEARIICLDENR